MQIPVQKSKFQDSAYVMIFEIALLSVYTLLFSVHNVCHRTGQATMNRGCNNLSHSMKVSFEAWHSFASWDASSLAFCSCFAPALIPSLSD